MTSIIQDIENLLHPIHDAVIKAVTEVEAKAKADASAVAAEVRAAAAAAVRDGQDVLAAIEAALAAHGL
jgi:hypothetical protein